MKKEIFLSKNPAWCGAKIFRKEVGFNPNLSALAESYLPARIPWFFSGKINR
jgi:hypothetical protein